MPKKPAEEFYLSNNPDYVPNPEIEEFMEEEISRAPKDPEHLAHRLRDNTAASPKDAGGDLDASWEDVNDSGSESVSGHNPTPDQSMVEENAHAMGVNFEDNEELDFLDKIERRDRDRFELEESSKADENMISVQPARNKTDPRNNTNSHELNIHQNSFRLSTKIVTGPSLTSSTCIIAPNLPHSTFPRSLRASAINSS